jgi:hypothetical protein
MFPQSGISVNARQHQMDEEMSSMHSLPPEFLGPLADAGWTVEKVVVQAGGRRRVLLEHMDGTRRYIDHPDDFKPHQRPAILRRFLRDFS